MSGVFLWAWNAAAGAWVKVAVTPLGLFEVDIDNFPADYPLPAADIADLKDVDVGNFPADYPLPAADIASLRSITDYPDPVISQPDPAALKHSPQTYDPTTPAWRPLASNALGHLLIQIGSLARLNDIDDVNVAAPTDGYVLYWDETAGVFQLMAIPSGAWADITGKPDSPSLEEMATEHEADGTHGDITPTTCTLKIDPTKEFFVPAQAAGSGMMHADGVYIDAGGEKGYAIFIVPQDFTAVTSVEAIVLPRETSADMHISIYTYWGAYNGGENWNVHNETHLNLDIGATVDNVSIAIDISSYLDVAPLTAGDMVLVKLVFSSTAVDSRLHYKGVRFKYT